MDGNGIPKPIATAIIEGKITNRIPRAHTKGWRERKRRRFAQPPTPAASEPRVRRGPYFDADRSVHGKPYAQVCISLPAEDLAEIDRIAAILRKSRSALFRTAIAELRADLVARRVAGIVGGTEVKP